MGLLVNKPEKELKIMGVDRQRLASMTNEELILLAQYRLLIGNFDDRNPLAVEIATRLKLNVFEDDNNE